jgi:hypothetical protein
MTVHVALLRGINVGKAKRVAMADLKAVAEALGHVNVRTLLNSGNLVFESKTGKPPAIGRALEQAIESKLGVASRVTVLTAAELEAIARANPLLEQAVDPTRLLVTILADPASVRAWGTSARRSGSPRRSPSASAPPTCGARRASSTARSPGRSSRRSATAAPAAIGPRSRSCGPWLPTLRRRRASKPVPPGDPGRTRRIRPCKPRREAASPCSPPPRSP